MQNWNRQIGLFFSLQLSYKVELNYPNRCGIPYIDNLSLYSSFMRTWHAQRIDFLVACECENAGNCTKFDS